MQIELLVGNTMNVLLEALAYEDGAYINDAGTATVTITDSSGEDVAGQAWPFALTYVPASNGNYTGVLSSVIQLVKGRKYTVEVTAIKDGNVGLWRQTVIAIERAF